MSLERLQKILAQAGLGSRRYCETLIIQGRVTINGITATIGMQADPVKDKVAVDGTQIKIQPSLIYIAMYKPRGLLSTINSRDPRSTARQLIDIPDRIYSIGRLDVDSEGLLLLTNDGDLTNRLTHPRFGHEKEYRVLVARQPDKEQLDKWRRGVVLPDGYRTRAAKVRVESLFGKGAWLRVILQEGRKRQIRETGSILGLPVVRIIRIRIGNLYLEGLKPGKWRYLTEYEVKTLKEQPDRLPKNTDNLRKSRIKT